MSGVNTVDISLTLINEAVDFVRETIPFLDRDYRSEVRDKLSVLLARVVQKHTSTAENTALIDAIVSMERMAKHAYDVLPTNRCNCPALDNGEHAPQPLCHVCTLRRIQCVASEALKDGNHGQASLSG